MFFIQLILNHGEPARIITGYVPYMSGKMMSDKMLYFKNNND
ncbi:MAG: hypothetical protein R6V14_09100 [Halanaerobiales bacterium]